MELETRSDENAQPKNSRAHGERLPGGSLTLGPKDVLIGKLTFDGDLTVLGTVEGELHLTGDVEVQHEATVKASIEARNVSVRGSLSGDVVAREKLLLAGSGVVSGNVKVARLAIEDGATLNGNVSMQAAQPAGKGAGGTGKA